MHLYFEKSIPEKVQSLYKDMNLFLSHLDILGIVRCETPSNEYGFEVIYILLSCVIDLLPHKIESYHLDKIDTEAIKCLDIDDLSDRVHIVLNEMCPFHYDDNHELCSKIAKYLYSVVHF